MANEYIYLRVNMQHREIVEVLMLDRVHGLLLDQPSEKAMNHFGKLEADEEIFAMVNPEWTHNYHKRKLEIN